LRIPRNFKLAAIEIKVEHKDSITIDSCKACGMTDYANQKILLSGIATQQVGEQTFIHELVHWILFMMGEHKLRNNEKFVDLFAHFLYQYEQTKEFSSDKKVREDAEHSPKQSKGRPKTLFLRSGERGRLSKIK